MAMWFAAVLIGCFALLLTLRCHAGETSLISVNSAGNQDQGHDISAHALSADGRFVAFVAPTSLVTGTSGPWGVLVRDRVLGTTAVVSVDSAGMLANATSQSPALSADGRYVAFQSHATNLVAGDTNGEPDIFVRDRQIGVTTRISVDSAGIQADNENESPAISADGRYVAFASRASNLILADTNPQRDIFVHDRATGETTRVSVDSAGLEANHQSTSPTLSADGRYVAFVTRADNLALGIPYSYGVVDFIVVHDRQTGETTLASVNSGGIAREGQHPTLSADGRYVAFQSNATNLVAGDTNGNTDIFLHDRQTGVTTRESVDSAGNQATGSIFYNHGSSFDPTLSANGRYVAFASSADNLVADDTNGNFDIFVHDRQTGATTRVNVNSAGDQVDNGFSDQPALSYDGRYVTFASSAADLVAGDTNGNVDIFVHDRGAPAPETDPAVRLEPETALSVPPGKKAIIITHGWNSDSDTWVKEMAEAVCADIPGATMTGNNPQKRGNWNTLVYICASTVWDVYVRDWRTLAATGLTNPMGAYVNAIGVGESVASLLKGANYKHIHFIAHSAGSNLVDFATIWLKAWAQLQLDDVSGPEIHATFLDAYDPRMGTSTYGQKADWADNYVDTRDAAPAADLLDGTKLFLQAAFNFDITPTVTPTTDGCQIDTWLPWVCRHGRPYRFYGRSIDPAYIGDPLDQVIDPISTTVGIGYPLSVENGADLGGLRDTFPPSGVIAVNAGVPVTSPSIGVVTFLTSLLATEVLVPTVAGLVDFGLGAGDVLFSRIGLGSLLSSSILQAQSAAATASATITEAPSWLTASTTTSAPTNTLRFNWRFASGGEGFVRIFVDDVLVRELDQRYLPEMSSKPEEIYVGEMVPGVHKLAFRLDGFGTSASGVELADVKLGTRVLVTATPNAGSPRTVRLGSLVTLDGTASTDSDNGPLPLSYLWTQVGTPVVTLDGATTSKPSFTPSAKGVYTFDLVVNDGQASSAPDSVAITVPTLGDIDLDEDVDNNDLNLVLVARNKPANGPNDLRDLDGNMKLDALDARKLTTLCTHPRCATQ